MIKINNRDAFKLAWVLEYVAEGKAADEPTESVCWAAMDLVNSVKSQLTPEEVADLDRQLDEHRSLRAASDLWTSNLAPSP